VASVYRKNDRYYARFKDGRGKWRDRALSVRTKADAKRLAFELEIKCERQRHGLEEIPAEDGGGTVHALIAWWLTTYVAGTPSEETTKSAVRHLLDAPLAKFLLAEVTSGTIETFLQGKATVLSPQSVNHQRKFLLAAFQMAKRAGRWNGTNPAIAVKRRRVPKRQPDFLRHHEVPLVLASLPRQWRAFFAVAILLGLRKGELIALRKGDVDLVSRLMSVQRSHGRDTTKGGHADAIPIPTSWSPSSSTRWKRRRVTSSSRTRRGRRSAATRSSKRSSAPRSVAPESSAATFTTAAGRTVPTSRSTQTRRSASARSTPSRCGRPASCARSVSTTRATRRRACS
jgi:integrase